MARQRLTVAEAVDKMGISQDAVRMRIKRGTLDAKKDGRQVFVLLDTDQTTDQTPSDSSALIAELRAHNETLRQQLEAERQAHAEARRLLLSASEKIPPAIEPPSEPRESPVEDADMPMGPETRRSIRRGSGAAWRPTERNSARLVVAKDVR